MFKSKSILPVFLFSFAMPSYVSYFSKDLFDFTSTFSYQNKCFVLVSAVLTFVINYFFNYVVRCVFGSYGYSLITLFTCMGCALFSLNKFYQSDYTAMAFGIFLLFVSILLYSFKNLIIPISLFVSIFYSLKYVFDKKTPTQA